MATASTSSASTPPRVHRDNPMPSPLLRRIRLLAAALLAWPAALRVWWVLRRHHVHGGRHAMFRGRAPVIANRGHLSLGDHLDIDGRAGPLRLTVQPGASLEIGHGGFINGRTTIAASGSATTKAPSNTISPVIQFGNGMIGTT